MCVGAHPDDHVLGVGGTLARRAAEGADVGVVLLSDGVLARYEEMCPEAEARVEERCANAEASCDVLGVDEVSIHGFAGNQLDDVPLLEIVRTIEAEIARHQPEVVYTQHYGDLNVDHQCIARAVMTACRPLADSPVNRVLAFETLSSSEWNVPTGERAFTPQVFVNVEEYLDRKLAALAEHDEELRPSPHPRNPEAVRCNARVWGEKFGLHAVEPFELLMEREP